VAIHQIYPIEGDEESEAFDDLGYPYIDPADLTRGTGNKYIRTTPREKVRIPQEAWDRAARAMSAVEPMTIQATPEALQAYQYRLARTGRELEKMRQKLDQRKAAADASSERRNNLSRRSGSSANNGEGHRRRSRSRLENIPVGEWENLIQNLDMSFMSIDTRGNIIPKTPEVGYMAALAFILACKP
jgi:hypothetical protein